MDLRKRVFEAMREGASSLEAGELFNVSDSWARKLRLRFQRSGTLEPSPKTQGRKREFLPEHEARLAALARERPDATNAELARALAEQIGRLFSEPMISIVLKRLGFTRKKRHSMRASSTAPTFEKRGSNGALTLSRRRPTGCSSSMKARSISP